MKNSIFFTLFACIVAVVIYGGMAKRNHLMGIEQQKQHIIDRDSARTANLYANALTEQNVWQELIIQKVEHPEVALRQAICETGRFACKGCSLDSNNLFGFCSSPPNWIKFDNWRECITYYKNFQKRTFDERSMTIYEWSELFWMKHACSGEGLKQIKIDIK